VIRAQRQQDEDDYRRSSSDPGQRSGIYGTVVSADDTLQLELASPW
jgi:hypothetical protein